MKEGSELGQPELLGEVGKVAVKRAVEGKDSSRGVKRSDSLTKDEKTENNTKEKERSSGRSSRRFIQRGETGLKRRHTVGGTRDFDKVFHLKSYFIIQINSSLFLAGADTMVSGWQRRKERRPGSTLVGLG